MKQKFQNDYNYILREKQLHQRIYKLLQILTSLQPWTDKMSKEQFNEIMQIRDQAILLADKKCRKLCMGQVVFSDKYETARKSIEL